jgi:hypothetical protein
MKKKVELFSILLLSSSLGIVWSGSQDAFSAKTVQMIHNNKNGTWGSDVRVKLELVRTLGGLDEQDSNLSFGSPYDVVVDSTGNIYVLDARNRCIQKISPKGKYLQTIGRPGQGPGEFQAVFSFDIDDEDILYVGDIGKIQILSGDGRLLDSFKLLDQKINQIRWLHSGLIARGGSYRLSTLMKNSANLPPLIEFIGLDGHVVNAFGEAADFKDDLVNSQGNNFQFDADRLGNIYVSFLYQNRIEKYGPDGKLNWRADRPLNYSTEVINKGWVKTTGSKRGTQLPQMNSVSLGIAADAKGRIWVNTYSRQMTREEQEERVSVSGVTLATSVPEIKKTDIHKLEIFGPDGMLLGEIPLNHLAHGIRIFGDSLFVWERNNAVVYQYRIVEH